MQVCFLDEKWFYGSSGRVRKVIQKQGYKTEEEAYLPAPSAYSHHYVNKVIFLGVIVRPITKLFFDGKIFLKHVSRTKIAQKGSANESLHCTETLSIS